MTMPLASVTMPLSFETMYCHGGFCERGLKFTQRYGDDDVVVGGERGERRENVNGRKIEDIKLENVFITQLKLKR